MTGKHLIVLIVISIVIGVAVRNWQCAEMFPNASRLACILWK